MARRKLPEDLITKLVAALGEQLKTLDDIEGAVEQLKAEVGQEAFDKRLAELPPEDATPKPCPRCGKDVPVHTKSVERRIESLSGTHTMLRHYHRCKRCRFGFYPRDIQLGVPAEGRATIKLEARIVDFSVTTPDRRCAERWQVHYPHRPFSANMFRRVGKRVGERLEAADPRVLQETLAPAPTGAQERLYVQNDGSMLPMLEGVWREAKVGVLVRGENLSRGHVSQGRYVAILGDQEAFKQAMCAALDAEKWQRFEQIVWMADGAKGNWTLAESICPTALQILDFTHAIEHGMTCGKALLGEADPALADWQRTIDHLLRTRGIDALVGELMDCLPETQTDDQVTALDNLVAYYRNNQLRMDYPSYLQQGLMIGTGLVEGAHRHVLQERMKLSGQHWSPHHGGRMAKLRAAYKTAGPKRFHDRINRALCRTYQRARTQQRCQAA